MAHTPHTLKVIAQLEQLKTPPEPVQNPFDPRSPMPARTPVDKSAENAPDTPTSLVDPVPLEPNSPLTETQTNSKNGKKKQGKRKRSNGNKVTVTTSQASQKGGKKITVSQPKPVKRTILGEFNENQTVDT